MSIGNAGEFYVQDGKCYIGFIGINADDSRDKKDAILKSLDKASIPYEEGSHAIMVAAEHKESLLKLEGAKEIEAPQATHVRTATTSTRSASHRSGDTGPDGGSGIIARP